MKVMKIPLIFVGVNVIVFVRILVSFIAYQNRMIDVSDYIIFYYKSIIK